MGVYTDWTVGRLVTADRLNANLVETEVALTSITADSSTWDDTPEVSVMTVVDDLISGQVYKIKFIGRVSSGTAASIAGLRIREDAGVSGTQLNFGNYSIPTTTGNGFTCILEARYTAVATAAKTFTLTGQCTVGAVHVQLIRASANAPALLSIERSMD